RWEPGRTRRMTRQAAVIVAAQNVMSTDLPSCSVQRATSPRDSGDRGPPGPAQSLEFRRLDARRPKLAAQLPRFLEAPGHVAKDGDDSVRPAVFVADNGDREFERHPGPVPFHARDRQHVVAAVATAARPDCFVEGGPVALPQGFGD